MIWGAPDTNSATLLGLSGALCSAILIGLGAARASRGLWFTVAGAVAFASVVRVCEATLDVGLSAVRVPVDVMLLLVAPTVVLMHVIRQRRVTADLIAGALTVYFILGLLFGIVFETIQDLSPGAMAFPEGAGPSRCSFSFVPLTPLGYGDATPLAGSARSLAVLEAFLGQVFMVVLVARLVAVQVSQVAHVRAE